MWTVEWAGDPARSPNGQCFEFDSLIAFAIATRHFASRILTCGLMQTVESLEGGSPNSGVTEAQQEDITSAISLGMCLSYALRPSESMPITALGLVMPLQVAHSAWYRMKKRHSSTNAEEYQRAVRMKDWNMEGIHALENVWCDKHCNHERMDEYAEMVAGGKAFEYGESIGGRFFLQSKWLRKVSAKRTLIILMKSCSLQLQTPPSRLSRAWYQSRKRGGARISMGARPVRWSERTRDLGVSERGTTPNIFEERNFSKPEQV